MKLKKALYGLKQAPRAWNKKIDASLQKLNFTKCSSEHGVYVRLNINDDLIIIYLYVDDLLVTGSNEQEIVKLKRQLMTEYEMTDLGKLFYFLGRNLCPVKREFFCIRRSTLQMYSRGLKCLSANLYLHQLILL